MYRLNRSKNEYNKNTGGLNGLSGSIMRIIRIQVGWVGRVK